MLMSRDFSLMSAHRLVVRTPGFHPGNRSSILRGRAIRISPLKQSVSGNVCLGLPFTLK